MDNQSIKYYNKIFESDRIRYIPILMENEYNIEEIHRVMSSPQMEDISEKMILPEKTETKEETNQFIQDQKKDAINEKKMTYILEHKEDDKFIGLGTMSVSKNIIGFMGVWLRKEYWGKELSSERAHKFLEILFNYHNVDEVRVMCFQNNKKAKKSIEKYIKNLDSESIGLDYNPDIDKFVYLYRIESPP